LIFQMGLAAQKAEFPHLKAHLPASE